MAKRERERVNRPFHISYGDIVSVDSLLNAWREFVSGKRKRKDVEEFGARVMDEVLALHEDLRMGSYRHGPYHAFRINDPKPRSIHKATVRDRLVHHAVVRVLDPHFDRTFIHDSYSCRQGKGTHAAMDRFRAFSYRVSRNHTRTAWVLKCDIRKFFASIDHRILLDILHRTIDDHDVQWLLGQVIGSFTSGIVGVGLPLGNVTSQLLANVYLNEFDQFVKRDLRVQHSIRYADDFVVLHHDKRYLTALLPRIAAFLSTQLRLQLHPDKVSIMTVASGVDFLGWVHFPYHRVLRTATKRRMIRIVHERAGNQHVLRSYVGLLGHGNAERLRAEITTMGVEESDPLTENCMV